MIPNRCVSTTTNFGAYTFLDDESGIKDSFPLPRAIGG